MNFTANMNRRWGNGFTFLHCTAFPGALLCTTSQVLCGMIPLYHFVLETSACHHLTLTILYSEEALTPEGQAVLEGVSSCISSPPQS